MQNVASIPYEPYELRSRTILRLSSDKCIYSSLPIRRYFEDLIHYCTLVKSTYLARVGKCQDEKPKSSALCSDDV